MEISRPRKKLFLKIFTWGAERNRADSLFSGADVPVGSSVGAIFQNSQSCESPNF
jgi:hypothetical protein